MRLKLLSLIASLLVIGFVLTACGNLNGDKGVSISHTLLTTEKTLPENFYDIAEHGVLAQKVTNQDEFNAQWHYYGLEGNSPTIDWSNNAAIFLGVFESGSCPLIFKTLGMDNAQTELIVHLETDSKKQGLYG